MEPTTTELPVIFARQGEAGGFRIDAARPWMQTVEIGIERGGRCRRGEVARVRQGVVGVLLILSRALERSRCRSSGRGAVGWPPRHGPCLLLCTGERGRPVVGWAVHYSTGPVVYSVHLAPVPSSNFLFCIFSTILYFNVIPNNFWLPQNLSHN